MTNQQRDAHDALRKELLGLLSGGNAHVSFDDFVKDFPAELCQQKIDHLPYTAWQVLEHMRIAQWDIVEFCRDADHVSPTFPDGYWPNKDELGSEDLWEQTVSRFRSDLTHMEELVADRSIDLLAKIPHGDGQTFLREALLVADHNAYHLGVLAIINRLLKR